MAYMSCTAVFIVLAFVIWDSEEAELSVQKT